MWVRVVVCLSVDLRQTGNLSQVYPTSHPMEAGMGLSLSGGVEQKEGWMDRKVCLLNSLYSGSDSRVTQSVTLNLHSLFCVLISPLHLTGHCLRCFHHLWKRTLWSECKNCIC